MCFLLRSSNDMTHLWEVVDQVATKSKGIQSPSPASKMSSTTSDSSLQSHSKPRPKEPRKSKTTSNLNALQHQNTKKNFLDGFRSSLARPRTRSDDFGDDKGQFRAEGLTAIVRKQELQEQQQQNGSESSSRRLSETASSKEVISNSFRIH